MQNLIWYVLAGAGVYLFTKRDIVIPIVNNVIDDVIDIIPDVILPGPITVVDPVYDPGPTVIPSGNGEVLFVVDYNELDRIEDLAGTGIGTGWVVEQNIDRDGTKVGQIVNDPLGQKGRVLRFSYVGQHENPACLVNGIVPNYITDSSGWFDVYLPCLDKYNMRIWMEWGSYYGVPEVQTIVEEYDVLYLPIDPNQNWGPEAGKQHYWRGTTQNQTTVFWEDDQHMTMSYYQTAEESQARVPKFDRVNMKDRQWHHVKGIYRNSDPGQNNGSQDIWVDGLLEASIHNIQDTGNWWNGIHNYRQGSNNLYRYEANWVVTSG